MRDYPNVVQVVFGQQMHGKSLLNILHFKSETPISTSSMTDLGDILATWIGAALAPSLSEDIAWVNMLISSLDQSQPLQVWYPIDPIIQGGVASPALPANNAAMVRLLSGLLGSTNKGRQYHGGISEGQVSANGLAQTLITDLNDAYLGLLTSVFVASPWTVVIAQELSANDELPGTTATVIMGLCDDRVHDMGRRLNNR